MLCSGSSPTGRTCTRSTNAGTNNGCWVGAGSSGNSAEGMLGAARLAILDMHLASMNMGASGETEAEVRFRDGADIVVVILSDTEDQTSAWNNSDNSSSSRWELIENFVNFFNGAGSNAAGYSQGLPPVLSRENRSVWVDAIYCPSNTACGDPTSVPNYGPNGVTRIQRIVNETNGTLTLIGPANNRNEAGIRESMRTVVDRAIASRGVVAQKPFIGASLRVAIQNPAGECPNPDDPLARHGSNVPRSREDGFDYDGIFRTVSFFGGCRPPEKGPNSDGTSPVAISYLAWEALDRLPCEHDFLFDPTEEDYCRGLYACNIDEDFCDCPATCNDTCVATHGPAYKCKVDKGCACERDLG